MKILLVSYHYADNDSTGALRPRAMAKYLPLHGIQVTVLTYCAQPKEISFAEDVVGVRDVTRENFPLMAYYAWRVLQKGLRVLGFYRGVYEYWRQAALSHAAQIMSAVKPDAVLVSYPCVEALEIGLVLSEKYGLPLISDFRDGLLFEPVEEARMRHSATNRHYEALEAKVVARSSLVLTVSEPISAYFRERYAHPNVVTLHNGFDLNDVALDDTFELPLGVLNIVHTGRLGASRQATSGSGRGVDALSTALRLMLARSPEMASKFKLHFVGQLSHSEQSCLSTLVAQQVVKIWGHLPRAKALSFQRQADILLLITAPDQASIATGKLFEYLAVNRPILALTRGTEAAKIVRDTGSGVIVAPDEPHKIAEVMTDIVRGDSYVFGPRNEDLIAAFARDRQMALLASVLEHV